MPAFALMALEVEIKARRLCPESRAERFEGDRRPELVFPSGQDRLAQAWNNP